MAKKYKIEMLPTTLQPGYVVVVREEGNRVWVKIPGSSNSSAWSVKASSLPGFVPKAKPKTRKKAKKAKKKVTKKTPRKKAKKKARPRKKAPAKRAKKAPSKKKEAYCKKKKVVLKVPTGEDPDQIRDPKVDAAMIEAAFRDVGKEKGKKNILLEKYKSKGKEKVRVVEKATRRGYGWPANADYMTVAYGGGVDSTAILVGLDQLWRKTRDPKWIPVAVTFADTGGEHPETYDYIRFMDRALRGMFKGGPHHPGEIVKVAYASMQTASGWGTGYTLEVQCMVNQTAPSISMGGHTCSTKNKIDAQKHWFDEQFALHRETRGREGLPLPRRGKKILRAIGYDATEKNRLVSGGTYVAKDEQEGPFQGWYPLVEWGWDRARCIAEICAAIGKAPRKSSCFFCGYMKPEELVMLARDHPDLLRRAVFMERVWFNGRNKPTGSKGLMRSYSLTDFVLANVGRGSTLGKRQKLAILGGVAKISPTGKTMARGDTIGKPEPPPEKLKEGEFYVSPCGQLMSKEDVACLDALAKQWCRSAPDHGKRIPGWKRLKEGERAKGRKTRKVDGKTEVWDMIVNRSKAGQLEKDMSLSPMAATLPAFCKLLGFRAKRNGLDFYDLTDVHEPNAKATRNRLNMQKIRKIMSWPKHCRRLPKCFSARNPAPLPTPRNPMLDGLDIRRGRKLPMARNPGEEPDWPRDSYDEYGRFDPYRVLEPGGLPAWQECCKVCGLRLPGALGHGPPCSGHELEENPAPVVPMAPYWGAGHPPASSFYPRLWPF